jgi:NADPH-dependent F420 reductase
MNIAIIGAGNVGSAVARAGLQAGHKVTLTSAHRDKAQQVAAQLGAEAAPTNPDAVRHADLVVFAVPFPAVASIADEIRDVAAGKTVVDATNPMKPDFSGLATGDHSAAEEVQQHLPDANVVKAFNTVLAANMAQPAVAETALDGFYAGNDEAAKRVVAELLSAIGYRPIDAGDLTAARALEHMAFLNISLNARNNWSWQTGWKLLGPTG